MIVILKSEAVVFIIVFVALISAGMTLLGTKYYNLRKRTAEAKDIKTKDEEKVVKPKYIDTGPNIKLAKSRVLNKIGNHLRGEYFEKIN